MDFLRRLFGVLVQDSFSSTAPAEGSLALGGPPVDSVPAELDVDAAINAHERWKVRLMDYLEGRSKVGLDPFRYTQVRRGHEVSY